MTELKKLLNDISKLLDENKKMKIKLLHLEAENAELRRRAAEREQYFFGLR